MKKINEEEAVEMTIEAEPAFYEIMDIFQKYHLNQTQAEVIISFLVWGIADKTGEPQHRILKRIEQNAKNIYMEE